MAQTKVIKSPAIVLKILRSHGSSIYLKLAVKFKSIHLKRTVLSSSNTEDTNIQRNRATPSKHRNGTLTLNLKQTLVGFELMSYTLIFECNYQKRNERHTLRR
jgi:hypothetical protein